MAIDDRLVVGLPEGVEVELRLAGIASRGIAAAVDLLLAIAVILALGSALSLDWTDWWLGAMPTLGAFAVVVLWPAAWELFNDGRTPGKLLLRLRVADSTGAPLAARATVIRNMLRVVDVLPLPYGTGLAMAVITAKGQRLGDLAAGTVVVRDPVVDRSALAVAAPVALQWAVAAHVAQTGWPIDARVWDTRGLTAGDLLLCRRFLERRMTLGPQLRAWIGQEVASRILPKVVGPPPNLPPEALIEGVVLGRVFERREVLPS